MKSKSYWTISFTSLLLVASILLIINITPLKERIFVQTAEYAGSHSCKECHEEYFNSWVSSHHFMSSDSVDGKFFRGEFNDRTLPSENLKARFFSEEGKPRFAVSDDEQDEKIYPVIMSVGYFPFQQFVADTGAGRLQVIPCAWDSRTVAEGGQEWYIPDTNLCLRKSSLNDWRGARHNWNSRCASCHSTGVVKNFNPKDLSYATTYSEINIGCEACHGPGSNHNRWAVIRDRKENPPGEDDLMGFTFKLEHQEKDWSIDPVTGNARPNSAPLRESGINLCARCHSVRREIVAAEIYTFHYWDDFLPVLLNEDLYYPDGGIRGQAYSYGSFLQSRMYKAGITCIDCHDAHSGKLFEEGNKLCSKCHDPKKYDTQEHHFHNSDSTGGSCIACHMPSTILFGTDHRADHYIRIPRPDHTITTGSPNACIKCHFDGSAEWALEAMLEWYGKEIIKGKGYEKAFHKLWSDETSSFPALSGIIRDTTMSKFIRASALASLTPVDSVMFEELVKIGAADDDPMMRYAAGLAAEKADPVKSFELAFPLMDDDERAIRFQALESSSKVSMDEIPRPVRGGFSQAMTEYINLLVSQGDLPENIEKLGDYYAFFKDFAKAVPLYEKALKLDPSNTRILKKLMGIYSDEGDTESYKRVEKRLSHILPDA